jgi:hypothetical protein
MGYSLAWQAGHPYWLALLPSHVDRLIINRMALMAIDPDSRTAGGTPACLYFAGYEPLIMTISVDGSVPEYGSASWETQRKKVQRSINRLIKAGAIERLERGTGQRPSKYRLTLGSLLRPARRFDMPVDNPVDNSGFIIR